MKKLKETAIRIALLFVGLTIAHLGVSMFLLANLGSDPFNVFIQGLFRTTQKLTDLTFLTHGYTHMAISILIIIVLLFVDKSYVKIGTILCMFCGGPIIDFFNWCLSPVIGPESNLLVRLAFNAVGCVILALGMTIVIKSDAGTGPNDLVGIVISDKMKKPFSIVRIIVDCIFIVLGFALGGSFGVGTLICAFLVGPVAGYFMPHSQNFVNKVLNAVI